MRIIPTALLALVISVPFLACSAIAADLEPTLVEAEPALTEDSWDFGIAVYGWLPTISTGLATGDTIELTIDEILENLNFTGMVVASAETGRFGIYSDNIYLNLGGSTTSTGNIIGNPVKLKLSADLQAWISTTGVGYRLIDTQNTKISALGGFRYLWLDTDLKFTVGPATVKANVGGDAFDGIVGLRGQTDFNERWYATYYLDVGAGESDFTWQGFAGLNYRFRHFDGIIGYRYLHWEFDNKSVVEDMTVNGPMIGARFRF